MGGDDLRTWQEYAATNRERIRALEREQERMRAAIHELRKDAQAVSLLTEKVAELAAEVRSLRRRVATLSRHVVRRPSQSGLQVFGQYVGLVVAIIALALAAR